MLLINGVNIVKIYQKLKEFCFNLEESMSLLQIIENWNNF